MTRLRVKNWERFQHYKNRHPPWIKLYTDLLTNYEFTRLPDASRAHLAAIWLLASRSDGWIPDDVEWLGRQISATSPVDLEILIVNGFLERASNSLPIPAQDDGRSLDQRREETEGETEKRRAATAAGAWAREVRAKLPEEYRPDFDAQVRASHRPEALVAELRKIMSGEEPGCQGMTPEHIGSALRDAALAGGTLTGGKLRGFIRGAMRPVEPRRAAPMPAAAGLPRLSA